MISFVAALGFLTILPIPRSVHENPRALEHAVWWFPAVGLVFGLCLASLDAAYSVFPTGVRAVLTVLTWVALSRGLHVDGLADTADGLLSFKSREKMLEIMRDPRSGPMGVAALAGDLALKMTAVTSLSDGLRWKILLLAPLIGRSAMGGVMGLYSYARKESGLATPFQGKHGRWKTACSFFVPVGISALGGIENVVPAFISLLTAGIFSAWVRRKIGGYTGDTLGATCEITEIAWLLLWVR